MTCFQGPSGSGGDGTRRHKGGGGEGGKRKRKVPQRHKAKAKACFPVHRECPPKFPSDLGFLPAVPEGIRG